MSFIRAVFLFALVMLGIGIIGTRYLLDSMFGSPADSSRGAVAAVVHRKSPTPRRAVATPTKTNVPAAKAKTAKPRATAMPAPTLSPTTTVNIVRHPTHRHVATARGPSSKRVPTSTPLPSPTVTPTSGIVTLTSYWVGSSTARPGQTVSIGYVINNGTGQTARISLGASIKSSHVLSWLSGQINDPYHDVVAIVPPGVSTHIRYFTLPSRLRAGSYDVAWGLSSALNGAREALVAAPGALAVSQ